MSSEYPLYSPLPFKQHFLLKLTLYQRFYADFFYIIPIFLLTYTKIFAKVCHMVAESGFFTQKKAYISVSIKLLSYNRPERQDYHSGTIPECLKG